MRPRLTAIVTTLNEAVNIRECLEGLAFVDEILLVDSFSTDATVEIARSIPRVQVVQHEYFGSAAQKNWAMDQVTTPWLLIVDADERIPPELAQEILRTLERGPAADHYFIRRQNVFLDRVIRHSGWSTDKVVRLDQARHGAVSEPARPRGPRRGRADADAARADDPPHLPLARAVPGEAPPVRDLGRGRRLPAGTARRPARAALPALVAVRADVRRPGRIPGRPRTAWCSACCRPGASF